MQLLPGGKSPKFHSALVTNDILPGHDCRGTACRKDILPGGFEPFHPLRGHQVLDGVCGKATKLTLLFDGKTNRR